MKDDIINEEGEHWEFDEKVTERFDDMLERSIPGYATMRDIVSRFALSGMSYDRPLLVDLGSSRGESVAEVFKHKPHGFFHLVEHSKPMLKVLSERYPSTGFPDTHVVIHNMDLKVTFPLVKAHVVQAVLTLCFIPINYRQRVIQNAYDALHEGGMFIVVEKLIGASEVIDSKLRVFHHAMKHDNGYTYEQIDRKSAALEGVLSPLTADYNMHLLKLAGFRYVDCVWRHLNFAAFVAIK